MLVQSYNFLFHPFSVEHSTNVKALSLLSITALSFLSVGVFLIIFGTVHLSEISLKTIKQITTQSSSSVRPISIPNQLLRKIPSQPIISSSSFEGFVGIAALKQKQYDHLEKLKILAINNEWEHIQTHTLHKDSGFDWWMFPINLKSDGYGNGYRISNSDISALQQDDEFMKNYREGVILVASSWRWYLTDNFTEHPKQCWTNYQVRLGKMLHSLILFNQKELHQKLIGYIDQKGIKKSLTDWIQPYLKWPEKI